MALTWERGRLRPVSGALASLFLVASLTPLASTAGRGLRLSWVLFSAWAVTIVFVERSPLRAFARELGRRQLEIVGLGGWLTVVLANYMMSRGYTGWPHLMYTVTLVMTYTMAVYYAAIAGPSYRLILWIVICAIGLTALWSVPVLWQNPGISRELMSPALAQESLDGGIPIALGSYGTYTSGAIAFPILLAFALRSRGATRLMALVSCVAIALAIVLATFTASVVVLALGIVLFFVLAFRGSGDRERKRQLTLAAALTAGCVIWVWHVGDSAQVKYVTEKFTRLVTGVQAYGVVAGDDSGRGELMTVSWQTFTSHPLIGIGPSTLQENPNLYRFVGGHSSWVDQLAEYGILGFGWYLLFLFACLLRVLRAFVANRGDMLAAGRMATCLLFIVMGFANPVVFVIPVFMLLVFGCFAWPQFDSTHRHQSA